MAAAISRVPSLGVFIIRALLFGVCIRYRDFGNSHVRPYSAGTKGSCVVSLLWPLQKYLCRSRVLWVYYAC